MKWKIVFILLAIGAAISMISPLRYHFTDKDIDRLPPYISHYQAVDSLAVLLSEEAGRHNCRDYIRPVELEGGSESLPNLRTDLNLVLAGYDRWSVSVDEREARAIRERHDQVLSQWGGIISPQEIGRRLEHGSAAALRTRYAARASLERIPPQNGNDRSLTLDVIDEMSRSRLFSVAVNFADPETVASMREEISDRQEELNLLRTRSRQGLYAAAALLSIAFIMALGLLVTSYIARKKYEQELVEINNEIQKRQELVDNGHFVAALELADRFLQYYPHDVEIKAFKERLLDYTNDDPKKAQIAYVEYMKVQERLSKRVQGAFLSEPEKEQITNLLPYHPKLAETYPKLISYEKEERMKIEFTEKLEKVKDLLDSGSITEADAVLKELENRYPETSESQSFRQQIINHLEKSAEEMEEIYKKLEIEDAAAIRNMIKVLLDRHNDLPQAKKLLKALEETALKNGFRLIAGENDYQILVHYKPTLILGREEEGVQIDIPLDDKHISRPHLRIMLEKDKITLEDLESSGGSYLNGERFSRRVLKEKDLLTLGKVVDIDYKIVKNRQGSIAGMLINFPDTGHILMINSIGIGIDEARLTTGTNRLIRKKSTFFIKKDNELEVITQGNELVIDGLAFEVQTID